MMFQSYDDKFRDMPIAGKVVEAVEGERIG